ncbi:MAG: HAMP domain-containing protein [Planctomycetaceae bacterium]|nr:HAMP domain-containing protein [Planctomycetaceae bacterium]
MWNSRLFWRIFAIHAALTLSIALVALLVLTRSQRKIATEGLERELTDAAITLRAGLSSIPSGDDLVQLDRAWKGAARATGRHLTLVVEDGTVVADTDVNASAEKNVRGRPEFLDARDHDTGLTRDRHPVSGEPMIYAAVRLNRGDETLGFVRVGESFRSVDADVGALRQRIVGIALAAVLVGMALTGVTVARITRPLERLSAAAQAVADGDEPIDVESWSQDEIGRLASAFRTMSRQQLARIAELQAKGRQLEESSELLKTVLGGMIEGVIAIDQHERILFANQAARYMLDLSESTDIGRPIWESVRNQTISTVVRNALAGRENTSVEIQLPRSQTVVAILASRLPGEPCPGIVLVLHDVTDLRRLENLRTEFASNVSHELKTPLTSIKAYTETLLDGAVDDPVHNRSFLRRIDEQAERLHKLILDLLQLSQIESGKDVFDVVAVPIDRVIHTCVDAHAAVARSKGVTLSTEPHREGIRVQADAEGLRTILDNLVDNAIKYTPERGSVTVRWKSEGRMAVIQVQDTGVGIAPPHLERIFERFYRVDKARSRDMGGTGLGLSIVKHLTEVFNGDVDVESRPGEGSTFSVRLPLVA